MMVKLSVFGSLLLCVLLCLNLGCSTNEVNSTLGSVSGKVTLDGAAFTDCKVAIYSTATMETKGANVDAEGTYSLREVVPGDYVVMILPPALEDDAEVAKIPIPKKLRSRKTTNLKVTVTANENSELDVELKP